MEKNSKKEDGKKSKVENKTTIAISQEARGLLKTRRMMSTESYDSVIKRIAKKGKDNEVNVGLLDQLDIIQTSLKQIGSDLMDLKSTMHNLNADTKVLRKDYDNLYDNQHGIRDKLGEVPSLQKYGKIPLKGEREEVLEKKEGTGIDDHIDSYD